MNAYLTCEELYNNLVEKINRTIQIAIDDCFFTAETLCVFINKQKGRHFDVILRQITNKVGKPITNDTYTDIRKNAKKYFTRTYGIRGKIDFMRVTVPKNDKIVEWFMTQTYEMLSMEHMASPLSVQYRQALLAHKKTGPVDDCHKCGEHPYQCECEPEDDEEACCECCRPIRSCWCREVMYDDEKNSRGYYINNKWISCDSDDEDEDEDEDEEEEEEMYDDNGVRVKYDKETGEWIEMEDCCVECGKPTCECCCHDEEDSDDEDDNVPIAKLIEERKRETIPIAQLIERRRQEKKQQQAKPVVVYTGRKVLVNLKTRKVIREICPAL